MHQKALKIVAIESYLLSNFFKRSRSFHFVVVT